MTLKRILFLLWLPVETILAGVGFVVIAKGMLAAGWLPRHPLTSMAVGSITMAVVFGSLWSHGRAEAAIARQARDASRSGGAPRPAIAEEPSP